MMKRKLLGKTRPICKTAHEWTPAGWGKAKCANCPRVATYDQIDRWNRMRAQARIGRIRRQMENQ